MSDLDNMSEVDTNEVQPSEVVETSNEELQSTPQDSNTEQELVFIEDEGDQNQPKSNMSQEQAYAAFRKEQDKRKRKQAEIEAGEKERAELREKIAKLESTVGSIAKGSPPTLESCGYDEEEFSNKIREYYEPTQAKQHKEEPKKVEQLNDEADFYHYQKSAELKAKLPDYDEIEAKARKKFESYGGQPDVVVNQLSTIAQRAGADIGKALYAFGRSDKLVADLNAAVATGNQFAIAEVLKTAAGKIKPREHKALDTQPTPDINSSGSIDNMSKSIEKAKAQWMKTGSIADYNAYRNAKKAAKS